MSNYSLVVTQIRSAIGRHSVHKACLKGLGIRRMHKPVRINATAENIGMVNKVAYLLKVEGK